MATVAVVTSSPPFAEGGHLVMARELVSALREEGHETGLIVTPQNRFGRQGSAYLAAYCTDVQLAHEEKKVDREGHNIATVNRALSTLRAAINWGRFQDPPILSTSPFHRFGVTIKAKEETKRDRRIGTDEEQSLLSAAQVMNSTEHKFVGSSMHDRLIGALETCCRQGEMLRIQNRHVDWEHHQIAIPGHNAKDAENRRIPFDPHGRLTPVLKRRAALGPNAYVFGTPTGEFQQSFKTAWEALLLVANGFDTKRIKRGAWTDRDREKLRQIDLHDCGPRAAAPGYSFRRHTANHWRSGERRRTTPDDDAIVWAEIKVGTGGPGL